MSEMYACDLCGKPTTNFERYLIGSIGRRDGYSLCDDCREKEKRETAWENEQWHKDEITCPWCGYEDPDSWEFGAEYDEEYECPSCGKPFVLEKLVEVTYTSKRRIEDMPEGWDGDGA